MKHKTNFLNVSDKDFEVVVVEDNKLANVVLSRELDSTINKIMDSKNHPIKLSSFQLGADFLNYLESIDSEKSRLIVFSDFHLENEMNGTKILREVKQKGIEATVIIMSDTTNKLTWANIINMGAHRFLHKNIKTPTICSQILYQMLN
ncbi:MAG: response regulator [Bacteroidota bacterium]